MKKLRDIMLDGFLFMVQHDTMVAEAVHIMTSNNVGIVSVLNGDKLVGIFSERDVVQRVVARRLDPAWTPVGDVMTSEIIIGDADEDYLAAMHKMDRANIRHLPVVSEGCVLSMLSIRDLVRVNMRDKDEEIRYLHAYLYQVPSYHR